MIAFLSCRKTSGEAKSAGLMDPKAGPSSQRRSALAAPKKPPAAKLAVGLGGFVSFVGIIRVTEKPFRF